MSNISFIFNAIKAQLISKVIPKMIFMLAYYLPAGKIQKNKKHTQGAILIISWLKRELKY